MWAASSNPLRARIQKAEEGGRVNLLSHLLLPLGLLVLRPLGSSGIGSDFPVLSLWMEIMGLLASVIP